MMDNMSADVDNRTLRFVWYVIMCIHTQHKVTNLPYPFNTNIQPLTKNVINGEINKSWQVSWCYARQNEWVHVLCFRLIPVGHALIYGCRASKDFATTCIFSWKRYGLETFFVFSGICLGNTQVVSSHKDSVMHVGIWCFLCCYTE